MRIYGIDASLSSSGVCVLDTNFVEECSESLLKILINPNHKTNDKEKLDFERCVSLVLMTQIETPRILNRNLTKIRKRIRDDSAAGTTSEKDINLLESILIERMKYQVDEICSLHKLLNPNITFIEDYSFHSQGSLVQLAEMKGFLKAKKDFDIRIAPINSVKKIGSTNGNANKDLMFERIQRFPIKNVNIVKGNDDEIDALAICLSTYYALYFKRIGFDFPKGKTSKEKSHIKSWINCLNLYSNHIGF